MTGKEIRARYTALVKKITSYAKRYKLTTGYKAVKTPTVASIKKAQQEYERLKTKVWIAKVHRETAKKAEVKEEKERRKKEEERREAPEIEAEEPSTGDFTIPTGAYFEAVLSVVEDAVRYWMATAGTPQWSKYTMGMADAWLALLQFMESGDKVEIDSRLREYDSGEQVYGKVMSILDMVSVYYSEQAVEELTVTVTEVIMLMTPKEGINDSQAKAKHRAEKAEAPLFTPTSKKAIIAQSDQDILNFFGQG